MYLKQKHVPVARRTWRASRRRLARRRFLVQVLHRRLDRRGVVALFIGVLPETTLATLVDSDVAVYRHLGQAELGEPVAVLLAQTGLAAERLDDKRKAGSANLLRRLFVEDVQRSLVDETHVDALGTEALGGVVGAVDGVAEADDVTVRTLRSTSSLPRTNS